MHSGKGIRIFNLESGMNPQRSHHCEDMGKKIRKDLSLLLSSFKNLNLHVVKLVYPHYTQTGIWKVLTFRSHPLMPVEGKKTGVAT